MENLTMECDKGLFCMDAQGITIRNLNLRNKESPSLTFINSKNVKIEGLVLSESTQSRIAVHGDSENLTIDGKSIL